LLVARKLLLKSATPSDREIVLPACDSIMHSTVAHHVSPPRRASKKSTAHKTKNPFRLARMNGFDFYPL
jgi:hypothetical protein